MKTCGADTHSSATPGHLNLLSKSYGGLRQFLNVAG
ncbi:hypothetical protein RHECNPAF_3500051 [Rhizobium etli CNPAF512]|nr:hypothetical protein RHECNPAF_3500051 [Rhizobium etli CNPAF512]